MSRQLWLLIIALAAGALAYFFSGQLDLTPIADKAPVVLAVFMAALFVRLARGVPTFPFEKIPQKSADQVLEALAHLRGMYGNAFISFFTALLVSLAYSPLMASTEIGWVRSLLTGLLTTTSAWAAATAYLIYRTDIALFKAQSNAIQTVVDDLASASAASSVQRVRENLRRSNGWTEGTVDRTDGSQ